MKLFYSIIAVLLATVTTAAAQQDITVTPTEFNYGSVNVGDSDTRGFLITNDGNQNLAILGTSLTGPDSGQFQITQNGNPTILSPGQQRLISVRFRPTTIAGKTAFLKIDSDDPNEAVINVLLAGTGVGVPDIVTDRNSYTFGNVRVGTKKVINVIVANTGFANLFVTDATIAGVDANMFNIVDRAFPMLINPLSQDTIKVEFDSTVPGNRISVLSIESNDPNENPLNRTLTAAGVSPIIDTDVSEIDYMGVNLGGQDDMVVRISNSGTGVLNIFSTDILGTNSDQFEVTRNGGSQTLNAGASRDITIRFRPTSEGAKEAVLQIAHDAEGTNPLLISLSGEGLGIPDIAIAPNALNFGNVAPGGSKELKLFVTNSGTGILEISSGEITGLDAERFVTDPSKFPIRLGNAEVDSILVTYSPVQNGENGAIMTLVSNDPNESPLAVSLSGRGASAVILIDLDQFDFGDIRHETSSTQSFFLSNPGTSTLVVDTVRFAGLNPDDFELTGSTPPFNINANSGRTLNIRFNATGDRTSSAVAIVESNAGNEPELEIALAARSVTPLIRLDQSAYAFGSVLVGQDSARVVTISNPGPIDLNIQSVRLSGADSSQFDLVLPPGQLIVPTQGSIDIGIIFDPLVVGALSSTLRVTSNDFYTPILDVPVSGNAEDVAVVIASPLLAAEDAVVSVNIPDGFNPEIRTLFYRSFGSNTYRELSFVGQGQTIQTIIPGAGISMEGLEYYIELISGTNATTSPLVNARNAPHFVPVRTASFESPFTPIARQYQMISVPLALDDQRIESVMIPVYGEYNSQIWRLFRWEDSTNVEYPNFEGELSAAKGFWHISSDGKPIEVTNAQTRDPAEPIQVILLPGWNQIGNPWNIDFSWPASLLDPRIEPPVAFDPFLGDFVYGVQQILPWLGYFVYNSADRPLTITFTEDGIVGSQDALSSDGPNEGAGKLGSSPEWKIQLRAEDQSNRFRDTQNYVGFSDEADVERDRMDWAEAPSPQLGIRLSVVDAGHSFAQNIKPFSAEGALWNLEVQGNSDNQLITVTLEETGNLAGNVQKTLIDMDRHELVDISGGSFTVKTSSTSDVRKFRFIVGVPDYAAAAVEEGLSIPTKFSLGQNYPNPFNPETSISYTLETAGQIDLAIYDVLGRRVQTLVKVNQEAGMYSARWDGRTSTGAEAATGMYIYQLKTATGVASRKMLLVR